MMGTGIAEGRTARSSGAPRDLEPAARGASVNGARGVIINVTGGPTCRSSK
jgi:hypothetical protein